MTKVSILGAGPAGSTAAYYLAKSGIEVELIDKVKFPRDKPCAGGLFNPFLFYKKFPFLKKAEGKYIYRAKFYAGKYSCEYKSKKPLLKMFLRKDFDYFLFRKAVKQGAKFYLNKKPEGDIVIDATGAGNPENYPKAGLCLVNDFKIKKDIDMVHVHYGFKGIKGYCWLYPKKGHANIGIGAYLPQKKIKEIYEDYIDFLEKNKIVKVKGKQYNAKIIPFAPAKRFYKGNTLFVGDRAGFVRPSTGEGIYFGMVSGKIAARTIIEKKRFSWYEQHIRKEFGEYLKPIMFGWSRRLLNKVLEKAVRICSKDDEFKKRFAENFFRMGDYKLGWVFLKNLIK